MPGCIKKIDTKGGGFALMQNIERFQEAAKAYGVPTTEVFQTVDLWERKNIPQVTQCIFSLGRTVRYKECIHLTQKHEFKKEKILKIITSKRKRVPNLIT